MEIEFKPSRDSVGAFAANLIATSKVARRQILRVRLFFGLILLPWGLGYFWIGRPYAGIVMSAIPVILILVWPRFTSWAARRNLAREYEGAKWAPWLSGDTCKLQIVGAQLLVSDAKSEGRIAADALQALHETPDHVFIYTGPTTAITVERSRVVSGDIDGFVSALRIVMTAQAA